MANTTYRELANSLFNKIKEYDFLSMDESTAYEIVVNYISPAAVQFQGCTQDLDDRDDEIQEFGFELTRTNFEILVNYMVIQWLTSNYILSSQSLKARLSAADFHEPESKDMLSKVTRLRSFLVRENNRLSIHASIKDSSVFDLVVNRKQV